MTDELNLSQVFKPSQNTQREAALDEADVHNHDHGTNMVNTFKLIEKPLKRKRCSASEQVAHASKFGEKSTSGSALLYADGLKAQQQNLKAKP